MTTLARGLRRRITAAGLIVLAAAVSVTAYADEPVRVDPRDERRVVVYPVADLLAPSPDQAPSADDGASLQASGDALIENLKFMTGRTPWIEQDSIVFHPGKQSLVVRTTPRVQTRLTAAVEELRREQSVHVRFHCRVLTGPRLQVADLGAWHEGELGKLEAEQLERTAGLAKVDLPVVSAFSGQAVSIPYDGRQVVVSATIAPDRRSVRLKISEGEVDGGGRGDPGRLVAASQAGKVRDRASAAFYFEAARKAPAIPPPDTAIERIVLVTPELVVHEEEEELLNVSR